MLVRSWSATLVAAALGAACETGVSSREIDRLLDEARAANAAALAAAPRIGADAAGRTLTVSGQLARGGVLTWEELETLATAHVRTTNPYNLTRPEQVIDYRSVLVRDLLARHQAAPDVAELTFVSIDGYRSTISAEDARRFPIALAIAADGAPIPRADGGPIYLIHPYTEFPESRRNTGPYWCFYVTHMIAGTEPARLSVVGGGALDAAALEKLPRARLLESAGWKIGWPKSAVALEGVALVDALAAAGAKLGPGDRVRVRGKAALHRDPAAPIELAQEDLARCGFLLATRWGEPAAPIPARLGGPLALAVPAACAATYGEKAWVPFVEELEIVRGAAP